MVAHASAARREPRPPVVPDLLGTRRSRVFCGAEPPLAIRQNAVYEYDDSAQPTVFPRSDQLAHNHTGFSSAAASNGQTGEVFLDNGFTLTYFSKDPQYIRIDSYFIYGLRLLCVLGVRNVPGPPPFCYR